MCMSSSISACMKAPGMSHVTTYQSSTASIIQVRKSASMLTVGELDSSLVLYKRCFLPSAQPRPLILPQRFCFKNIRYLRAAFFCSFDRSPALHPSMTLQYNNCSNSNMIALAPSCPKYLSPALAVICAVTKDNMSSSFCHSSVQKSSLDPCPWTYCGWIPVPR